MIYKNLGRSGLKVSAIGLGNWVNGNKPEDIARNEEILKQAWEAGINFFDTAEGYGQGQAEVQLGVAVKKLGVPRSNLVISTKIYLGFQPNNGDVLRENALGTSAKHVAEAMTRSLKNLQMEYVDIIFAHRFDYDTPMEETCRAFDSLIRQGKAFYWGTSEWEACQIVEAIQICEKYGLNKPVAEQCQYNLLIRDRFENEYAYLFDTYGYGTTVWSPLCSGILTDKYSNGTLPEGSRFASDPQLKAMIFDRYMAGDKAAVISAKLQKLGELAKRLGATTAQLAMAWVVVNKDTSVAITGATSKDQMASTLEGMKIVPKITKEVEQEIEEIMGTRPPTKMNWETFSPAAPRR